uniref:NAD(P)-binding protein n=1 Tax=Panagrellus redivivus TaxID=6233 RepID=A0A7E4VGA0_PANRE
MGRFTDKVVIVTGSSAEGANVVLHGTNTNRLAEAEKALHAAGIPESRILKIQGYLNEDAVHDRIINETVARFGKIDVLVNNAGLYKKPGQVANDTENFDHVFAVNVRAVFRLVELATPHLEKTKGNIINVSSVTSFAKPMETGIEFVIYSMTKAAQDRFTQNINQSLMKKGIRINNINPGPFVSNALNRAMGDDATNQQAAAAVSFDSDSIIKFATAAKRFGDVEELVPAFLLMADEKSSFITGSIWVIDVPMCCVRAHGHLSLLI